MFTIFEPFEKEIENFLTAQREPRHSEEGEERPAVEKIRRRMESRPQLVWYELLVFARPHHILARIAFPFVGLFQRKFARDSGRAMLEAVCR